MDFLILFAAFLSACGGGSESTSSTPSPRPSPPSLPSINTTTYFPLTVGNEWIYSGNLGSQLTLRVLTSPAQFSCVSQPIRLSELPGVGFNASVFLSRVGNDNDLVTIGNFEPVFGTGFSTINYLGIGAGKSDFMILPGTVRDGDIYKTTIRILSAAGQDFSCLPDNSSARTIELNATYTLETVNVPAFIGETIKVDLNDQFGFRATWWFANEIGLVKFNFPATGIDNEFILEGFVLQ